MSFETRFKVPFNQPQQLRQSHEDNEHTQKSSGYQEYLHQQDDLAVERIIKDALKNHKNTESDQIGGYEDYSSDEEEVEELFKEFEPDQYVVYLQSEPKQNIKDVFDEKTVLPFLMGSFVNGELDIDMCKNLPNRTSRRKLFRKLLFVPQ